MHVRRLATAISLLFAVITAGAASAQVPYGYPPQNPGYNQGNGYNPGGPYPRGYWNNRSNHNLCGVRNRLNSLIQQLRHDGYDYSGYRMKTIQDLQVALNDLNTALQTEQGRYGQTGSRC